MNKINIALFFATLMVIGVCAEPRKLLTTKNVETRELQRILAELEEVHQLRERMLHDGGPSACATSSQLFLKAYHFTC